MSGSFAKRTAEPTGNLIRGIKINCGRERRSIFIVKLIHLIYKTLSIKAL